MSEFNKLEAIKEIREFIQNDGPRFKYLVKVEADNRTNEGFCIFNEPNKEPRTEIIKYVPFLFIKDLKKINPDYFDNSEKKFYNGSRDLQKIKMDYHGIEIKKLNDGNAERLVNGYNYLVTSTKSFNSIIEFFREGSLDFYRKKRDKKGRLVKNLKGEDILVNKNLFYSLKPYEQFLVYHKTRLFNGIENYSELRKLIFDIETHSLRPELGRVFAIGIKCNFKENYETILEAEDNDASEVMMIQKFFNLIDILKPNVIIGHNIFEFDFPYIFKRAEILGMNLKNLPTGFDSKQDYKLIPNSVVKIGSNTQRFQNMIMYGYEISDSLIAARRQQAINSEIKSCGLKYLCKFERVAKNNRMYLDGGEIGKYWNNDNIFMINLDNNEYVEIPSEHQEVAKKLYEIQTLKSNPDDYKIKRNQILRSEGGNDYIIWFKEFALPTNKIDFITGKKIVRQYLLDDLYETQQIDELYHQSQFLVSKMIPVSFSKSCICGTASLWGINCTAYSYLHDIAIPYSMPKESFGGGYTRTFYTGFMKNIIKIDFSGLYPALQNTYDIFPVFDISNMLHKMLIYSVMVRDVFKHLSNNVELTSEEVDILKSIDHSTYEKYINNTLTDKERKGFKIKQLPLKTLNNSMFGALGSGPSFNWSDPRCASRITSYGRLSLRKVLRYFTKYGLKPLLMVTDGINLSISELTNIKFDNNKQEILNENLSIEEAWNYNNNKGLDALVEKFNEEELSGSMAIDLESKFLSGINFARINYCLLYEEKDKKTGEMIKKVKLTGSTIKSKVMSEYLEDFVNKFLRLLLENKSEEALNYYNDYIEDIFYKRIPLIKIASKAKVKNSIKDYLNRGNNKNGRKKGVQAHMELIIEDRNKQAKKIFEEKFQELCPNSEKMIEDFTIDEILKLVELFMPKEPELDSTIYYYNNGNLPGDADSKRIIDIKTGEERFAAQLLRSEDVENDSNILGEFNVGKYVKALNHRIWHLSKKTGDMTGLLIGFKPQIRDEIIRNVVKTKYENTVTSEKSTRLKLEDRPVFTKDELILDAYELDDFEDCFYLEPKEVEFWERYGYDPNKIFDGFKMRDDCKILPIYDEALQYLNDKMKASNKATIKRIDDDLENGDLVLLKDRDIFSLGLKENEYIRIIRESLDIPKTKDQLEIEKKHREELEILAKLKPNDYEEQELDETEEERLERFFKLFLEKKGVPGNPNLEQILEIEEAKQMWDDFVEDQIYAEENPDEIVDEEEENWE